MTQRIHYGRKRGAAWEREVCECGELKLAHQIGPNKTDCPCGCTAYRRKGAIPKGSRRSIRKYGIQAQHDWAKAAGFVNREGHGADSLYYGPDGEALLLSEHKHRPAPDYWEEDHAQAHTYAKYEKGRPFAVVGYTSKPGPGKRARRWMVIDAEEWLEIVERLGATDDP